MADDFYWEKLLRHESFLMEMVDPDSGLLDELLSSETLIKREIKDVKREFAYRDRNAKLLEYITDQGKFDSFVTALRKTKQEHVVNYLMADGGYRVEYELNWPLTDAQTRTLDANQAAFIQLIDLSELEGRLFSKDAISTYQKDDICSEANPDKKNELFLEFLRRRSQSDFKKTVNCLIETNQIHVADTLENGGVIVEVHAKTGASEKRDREIAEECLIKIREKSLEERMIILEKAEGVIIGAKAIDGIVFYVLCHTLKQIEQLQVSMKDGTFKESIELLVNKELPCDKTTKIKSIKIEDEEVARITQWSKAEIWDTCDNKAQNAEKSETPMVSLTKIDQMPFALLDVILQKCYICCTMHENPARASNQTIISQLSSVNFCWFQRLQKRNLKTYILRKLAGLYGRQKHRHTVILNNARYPQSLSLSSIFVDAFKREDCVTDVQAACIQRRRPNRFRRNTRSVNQNHALDFWKIVNSLDGERYSFFLRCMGEPARKVMSKLVENGGAVVKVELKVWGKTETTPTNSNMIGQLSALLNGYRSTFHIFQGSKLLKILWKCDLEILDASLDRDIVCWIYCRSQKGLKNLQHLDYRKTFLQVFARFVRAPREQRFKMNSDYENCKIAMVSFSASAKFVKRIGCRRTGQQGSSISGITKLGSYIYAVCGASCEIYVFEDQNEFRLQKKIALEYMSYPSDIGSSQEDNCLYVIDSLNACVWKIDEDSSTDKRHRKERIIKSWVTTGIEFRPWTLSVSSAGEVLITSFCWPPSLRVYDRDGVLSLSFRLTKIVTEIRHAVKTANGHFVILHNLQKDIRRVKKAGMDELAYQLNSIYWPNWELNEANKFATLNREKEGRRRRPVFRNTDETKETWVISEWNKRGNDLVRLFIPGNQDQILRNPTYLSVDSGDRLFVSSLKDDQVILFDADLQWKQTLFMEDTVGRKKLPCATPYRLFYDERIKQLVVAEFSTSIYIYTLTSKCKPC